MLRVTMFDKGREVVSATTRHACLETGGEFDAEWVAASAMTEPLKSVAYNVDLERAISSRLDEARRRGVIDVALSRVSDGVNAMSSYETARWVSEELTCGSPAPP